MNWPRFRTSLLLLLLLSLSAITLHAGNYYGAWLQEYDPTQEVSQGGVAVAFDHRGNLVVTGFAKKASGTQDQIYTAKYDGLDGHLIWGRIASTVNEMTPTSIAVDSTDAVIVTGSRNSAGDDDICVLKYTSDGTLVSGFPLVYDGPAGGQDVPAKVVVDSDDNIIVCGRSVGVGTQFDIVTLKWAAAGGAPMVNRYNVVNSNRDDLGTDVAVDSAGNVIVCGSVRVSSTETFFFIRSLSPSFGLNWDRTLDTGGEGGARSVAVDGEGSVYVTGLYANAAGHHGYYTVKYDSAGVFKWDEIVEPTADDFTGSAVSVVIGPDGHPVVTGTLENENGDTYARTIKYDATTGGQLWNTADTGFIGEDTVSRQAIVDGTSNTIIIGESVNSHGAQTSFNNSDVYLAKYDAVTGDRIWIGGFDGSFSSSQDQGAAIAVDRNGSLAATSVAIRDFNGTGRSEIATFKYQHFAVETGDDLPDVPGVPDEAKIVTAGAPAVSDNGALATKISFAAGSKKGTAILVQGGAGGTTLPAVQGQAAPGPTGAKFGKLFDPVIQSSGRIAFVAKMSGVPKSQSIGLWSDLSGTLSLVLQKGTTPPGLTTEKLLSIASISLRSNGLVALCKVSGSASSNTVLFGIDSSNAVTVLLRTESPVTVDGADSTIKSISVLTPPPASPGDGRWHGINTLVVRATLADKRTVLYKLTSTGVLTPLLFTNGDASILETGATYKGFGLPAIGPNGFRYAALATLTQDGSVTSSNDTGLVFSTTGTSFSAFAREDTAPSDPSLSSLKFAGFSDPLTNITGEVAFLATLKGSGVTAANNRAILFGSTASPGKIARTGEKATNAAGEVPDGSAPAWRAFTNLALSSGSPGAPIFLARLAGAGVTSKNNIGLWAVDTAGAVRRLIRTGDVLGDRTVKSINLLRAVPTAFTAPRSFDSAGSVAIAVTFTNNTTALLVLGVP